jgi:hypothetical protein
MRKMLARSSLEREKPKYNNEQQFNNFSLAQHKPRMSLDFKFLSRENPEKKIGEAEEQTNRDLIGKAYEKNIFDQSNYSCFVNYRLNDRPKSTIQDVSEPTYDPAKV